MNLFGNTYENVSPQLNSMYSTETDVGRRFNEVMIETVRRYPDRRMAYGDAGGQTNAVHSS